MSDKPKFRVLLSRTQYVGAMGNHLDDVGGSATLIALPSTVLSVLIGLPSPKLDVRKIQG